MITNQTFVNGVEAKGYGSLMSDVKWYISVYRITLTVRYA